MIKHYLGKYVNSCISFLTNECLQNVLRDFIKFICNKEHEKPERLELEKLYVPPLMIGSVGRFLVPAKYPDWVRVYFEDFFASEAGILGVVPTFNQDF